MWVCDHAMFATSLGMKISRRGKENRLNSRNEKTSTHFSSKNRHRPLQIPKYLNQTSLNFKLHISALFGTLPFFFPFCISLLSCLTERKILEYFIRYVRCVYEFVLWINFSIFLSTPFWSFSSRETPLSATLFFNSLWAYKTRCIFFFNFLRYSWTTLIWNK